jgi:hypothetical protein
MYQRPHTKVGGKSVFKKKRGVTEIAVLTIPHKRRPFPDAHRHFRLGESPCGDVRGTPYKQKQKHAPIKREMSPSMKTERSKSSGVYDAQEKRSEMNTKFTKSKCKPSHAFANSTPMLDIPEDDFHSIAVPRAFSTRFAACFTLLTPSLEIKLRE